MKILHLYANHKWTGPAELAVQQVRQLDATERCKATLALAGHHDPNRPHAIAARASEFALPVRGGLRLRRHFHARDLLRDALALARWINEGQVDLLHCHQPGDHLVASLAKRRARRPVPLVRSYWEQAPPGRGTRPWLSFRNTDRVLAPFPGLMRDLATRFPRLTERVQLIPPILGPTPDYGTERIISLRQSLRGELELDPTAFLIGLTARIQPRRRWNLAWDTLARLARRFPRLHLCILGRPDEGVFDRLCRAPLAERGLTHRVHFLGYRRGQTYYQALAAFDAFLFLVPGSDATCRALREAMALGLPCVTSNLGRLPEIVANNVTGCVRPADPDALAGALASLHDDPLLRERLGREAAAHAAREWQSEWQAERLLAVYGSLLNRDAVAPLSPGRP